MTNEDSSCDLQIFIEYGREKQKKGEQLKDTDINVLFTFKTTLN